MSATSSPKIDPANPLPKIPLDFCGMTCHYRVKWNLLMKCFRKGDERSSLIRIKGIDGLSFYMELYYDSSYCSYGIRIKTIPDKPLIDISLEYAFVTFGENVFTLSDRSLRNYPRLNTDKFKKLKGKGIVPDCESVTVHCAICIKGSVDGALTVKGSPEDEEVIECKIVPPLQVDTKFVEFRDYIFSGKIPTFTPDVAVSWIREADRLGLKELVVVGVKYLEGHGELTTTNVADVLRLALEKDFKEVAEKCAAFLQRCQINARR